MTVFSRTWNAAYEAQPADVENINLGASRVRDLKADIQERGEVDHSWAGDADDGEHKKITFQAPIAKPANVANKGFLYGKDVSAKVELHWEDEDGNEVALTAAGSVNAFPAATSMLFYQSAAPAGWTKDTAATLDNHALRVVTSTAWAGGSNGATGFSSVFGAGKVTGSHVLTTTEIPAHTHNAGATVYDSGGGFSVLGSGATAVGRNQVATSSVGSSGGHTHTLSLNLNYINIIRATKD